jgi:hypothetical protein
MYSGGEGYYWLVDQIGQQASYFAIQNGDWLFIAMDTGVHDYKPLQFGGGATFLFTSAAGWVNLRRRKRFVINPSVRVDDPAETTASCRYLGRSTLEVGSRHPCSLTAVPSFDSNVRQLNFRAHGSAGGLSENPYRGLGIVKIRAGCPIFVCIRRNAFTILLPGIELSGLFERPTHLSSLLARSAK